MTPEFCPHCGAEVPPHAKACPQCGSCEETGWSEKAQADHLDLPDEEFDYEDYLQREFAPEGRLPRGIHWFWWLMAIILIILFVGFFMGLR
jgi:uncharacterized membrane protein YvbJ